MVLSVDMIGDVIPAVWLRALQASAVVAAYATACAALYRHRRGLARAAADRSNQLSADAITGDPAPILVLHASQTGFGEELAWATARTLHAAGVASIVRPLDDWKPTEPLHQRALILASTYGEGDAPDTAANFTRSVMAESPDLRGLNYGVLALGDRSYTHFCGFGRRLDDWLAERGAARLFDRVELDNADTQTLLDWQQLLAQVAGVDDVVEWQAPTFEDWTLGDRRWLNDGSSGAPAFHIELTRPTGPDICEWEAGDLVEIRSPGDADRAREYSIASLPADGSLQLLVRQHRHVDGSLGVASGWLTAGAAIGSTVQARIRPHRHFRIGENANRPLILIGNGTGLAGLRSHIKARAAMAASVRPPCWLVFGERHAAFDAFHADEIDAWVRRGVLARVDRVYSRDAPQRRYVQHLLDEAADRVVALVEQGAAIYVCGSLAGMATGVDNSLRAALGSQRLDELMRQGRYRRDVY